MKALQSDLFWREQAIQDDTLMNAWQILQMQHIEPTASPNPSTKLSFYSRMPWLKLTLKSDVSASK